MSTAVTAAPPARVDSPSALGRLARAVRATYKVGTFAVVVLAADSTLVGVHTFFDLDVRHRWLELLDDAEPGTRFVLLSVRRGYARTARPSDETRWEQWCELADQRGVTLVDWWVLTQGPAAYSVAQYARRGAAWTA